jgi:hypothetical protein
MSATRAPIAASRARGTKPQSDRLNSVADEEEGGTAEDEAGHGGADLIAWVCDRQLVPSRGGNYAGD